MLKSTDLLNLNIIKSVTEAAFGVIVTLENRMTLFTKIHKSIKKIQTFCINDVNYISYSQNDKRSQYYQENQRNIEHVRLLLVI